ncbi:adenylate/guanylate cyclase domain-containing protein [Rossellomorea marisflavi]|uniref:adenylate/guanylate cyclase domain-containing protein n=1 Tax=Rossellomorea marisflavi TaxID=189381 RepID=UPI003FA17BF5
MPVISKSKYNDIETRIEKIFTSDMEVKDFSGDVVPTSEDLPDKNKGLIISNCTILFVDIRSSTKLSDKTQAKNMAKIYRAFARAMSTCINESGGRVRQISGDRVMGVFVDDADESSVQKAMLSAQAIQTVIEHVFNPLCRRNVNNKEIGCGIGIDTGRILTTSIGMKHKGEDSRDLVWTGKTANVSSKHTDLAEANEIFVTNRFYDNLPKDFKRDSKGNSIWKKSYRVKGDSIFEGYGVHAYYLDDLIDVEDEDGKEMSTPEPMKEAGGVDTSKIISSIVQGVEKRLEDVLSRHEKVVLREVSVSAREEGVKSKAEELDKREKEIKKREDSIRLKESKIQQNLTKKESEMEYQFKVNVLEAKLDFITLEEFLKELNDVIALGNKLHKKTGTVHNDLGTWRTIPFLDNNGEPRMAFQILIGQLTEDIPSFYHPLEMWVVPVIKRVGGEREYLNAVLYCIKNKKTTFDDILRFRSVLKQIGLEKEISQHTSLYIQ